MLKLPKTDLVASQRRTVPPLSSTVAASILTVADSIAILLAGYLTYDYVVTYSLQSNQYISAVVFVWLMTVALLNFAGLYHFESALRPLRRLNYFVVALAVAYLFVLAAAFSLKISANFSRIWITSFAMSAAILLIVERVALSFLFLKLLRRDAFKRSLAVIGEGKQIERFKAEMALRPDLPVRICGFFSVSATNGSSPPQRGLSSLISDARANLIDDVAIALPWSEDKLIYSLVSQLRELPVNVYLVSDLAGFRMQFKPPPDHFVGMPVYEVVGKPMSGWDSAIKLAEDLVLGLVILIAILPLLAVIALLVKLDSPGPVIFRQKRLGFNNQVFDVYKFRTMYHDGGTGKATRQATKGDPRITRAGRYLRRWSLDELPQIFNVLNGTMSLVGPRPHALDHNEEFARRMQSYFGRHRVKPGITGLAQVRGFRGQTDTEERLEGRIRNDLYYVENWSLLLDLRIIAQTAYICLRGTNAY